METEILNILKGFNPDITNDVERDLLVSGLIDSFDIVNLVATLEDTFSIEIEPEDIVPENFCDINAIKTLVEKCKGQ